MLLIGTKNIGTQTVLTDGIVNIGSIYRKYCKKNACGIGAFSRTANDISLQHSGIYHVTATLVGSGDVAGVITVQLAVNGELVDGAFSSQTITTADTELRTFVIDYYVLVDKDCILNTESTIAQTISFVNTSDTVTATFTSVIVNVDKVV
jgi:hypothetical protein